MQRRQHGLWDRGPGKKRAQLRGVPEEKKFVLSQPGNAREGIPLILFGFLY